MPLRVSLHYLSLVFWGWPFHPPGSLASRTAPLCGGWRCLAAGWERFLWWRWAAPLGRAAERTRLLWTPLFIRWTLTSASVFVCKLGLVLFIVFLVLSLGGVLFREMKKTSVRYSPADAFHKILGRCFQPVRSWRTTEFQGFGVRGASRSLGNLRDEPIRFFTWFENEPFSIYLFCQLKGRGVGFVREAG